ncbi:hypothetical protein ABIA31_000718 [Catenulispora sp. MAP5-51]|jgi:hypothetical protein|uniref:hypothetical protein n=1 Tax=Catenulispora sp. MAP5-51 TaxID=3156298 RepID=UPI003517B671
MPDAISRRLAVLAAASAAVAGTAIFFGPGAPAAHADITCSTAYLPLPDPVCTPGTLNPDVTQDTIDSTICVSGWTATVRPPTSYTNALKVKQIAEYGYSDTSTSDYEEDHFIPLELGGAPRDPQNLWPEPHYSSDSSGNTSYTKDQVENKLKKAVCDGSAGLSDAQNAIATDWTTALAKLGLS